MRARFVAASAVFALVLASVVAPGQPKRGTKPAPEGDTKAAADRPATRPEKGEKAEKGEKVDKGERSDKREKRAAEKKAAEPAEEEEEEEEEQEGEEEEEEESAGAADDLGAPPPKRAGPGADPRTRTSPLTPEPDEFPEGGAKPAPVDYDRLLGDIAALRSRVAALTTTLFASKLRVVVEVDDADTARIAGFNVTLDDGVVYAAPKQFSASEGKIVYEHAVSPGHHLLGIEVERYDAQNREYKSWQASKFSIVVPESQLVEAEVRMEDDSSMAEDFPSDRDGEYDLRVRLRARVID